MKVRSPSPPPGERGESPIGKILKFIKIIMFTLCQVVVVLLLLALPLHSAGGRTYEQRHLAEASAASLPALRAPADRLAVMVVFTSGFEEAAVARRLRCSLLLLQRNLGGSTPIDIYVWLPSGSPPAPVWLSEAANTHVLNIPPAAWRLPAGLRNSSTWAMPETSLDYRLMGQWRLGFSFWFARARGHEYLLQADDDTFLHTRLSFDVVSRFRARGVWVANRALRLHEVREVTAGLPELAAHWLASRKTQPTGPLWAHCSPPNSSGLHTAPWDPRPGERQPPGWDAQSLAGHFTIFSLEWWFSPPVQDFLGLVWRSNGVVEERWNELGPQSMLRHLLCPDKRFYVFEGVLVVHKKKRNFLLTSRYAACSFLR